ncbi:LysR substrate-binding domain-containing protein [Salinisphaera sp.]|uniref:LysR substrate-binding domain-containing protein n=1 Tax=Salinisphaera sp. TaxID=1914330 RepID=UPI000C47BF32|nr:LysR substrate-binding domain-containing protein [Salinisphaera sp.]MBS63924.1 LysR family transcriptional regulator [Salinisphaera sp.]
MIRSLDALRVFIAVARAQSMTVAAEQLFVTPGAVSKRIRDLERELGARLFEREHHVVRLTNKGRELYRVSQDLFDTLANTLTAFEKTTDFDQPLVVSCEPTIAIRWLIQRLPAFYRAYPHITLHLFAAGGPVDFRASAIDVALRRDDFDWGPALYSRRIADEITGIVGLPEAAADTSPCTILHTSSRPSAWQAWRPQLAKWRPIERELTFEHFYLSLQAARAGLGFGIGSVYMVEQQIGAGELEAPLGFKADGSAYWLLCPSPIDHDPRKRALVDWLETQMQASARRCLEQQ